MGWQKIEVNSSRPYPIILGNPLSELGAYLKAHWSSTGHVLVISHPEVLNHYQAPLLSGLNDYKVDVLVVPPGEQEKSLTRLNDLTTQAVSKGADRHTLVIALGGGVIGDLAGFFASVYMRGVKLVQVPTTLLAQVDSSIGGKVAVNHEAGKNLIGAFYPPMAVWTDFSTLETLPWSEIQNGLAETIKHALIDDLGLFEFLEEHKVQIRNRESAIYREMVTRSLAVKVRIVSQDEKEQGVRALLNLGHSFGHALETYSEYQEISHGQGVSVGLVAAGYTALEKGYIQQKELDRIIRLLHAFDLPTSAPGKDPERLLQLMAADKKNRRGQKVLILPKGLGKSVIDREVDDDLILYVWEKLTQE